MNVRFERTSEEGCLSDLALDGLVGGDAAMTAEQRRAAERHLAGCARCRERKKAIEAERAAFDAGGPAWSPGQRAGAWAGAGASGTGASGAGASGAGASGAGASGAGASGAWAGAGASGAGAPSPSNVVPLARLPAKRSWIWEAASAAGALAAGLALFVWLGPHVRTRDAIRTKGGVHLGFFVKHQDQVRRAGENEIVAPGDALRFAYTSQVPMFLAILSVDPAQRVSIYFPPPEVAKGAGAAVPERPGREVALPVSTVLDETTGRETIFGVFCDRPIELSGLKQELAAHPEKLDPPKGCTVVEVPIEKRKLE